MGIVEESISENMRIKKEIMKNPQDVEKIANVIIDCFKNGNKILLCGNGGSASDSQHIAAELVNKFKLDRNPLPAIALTTDTSILTSIANDYGFKHVFEKQVEALGKEGDVLIGITTSGKSPNLIHALEKAREKEMKTIALTGESGISAETDICFKIPSGETPRVQEAHITVLHIICDIVEKKIFG